MSNIFHCLHMIIVLLQKSAFGRSLVLERVYYACFDIVGGNGIRSLVCCVVGVHSLKICMTTMFRYPIIIVAFRALFLRRSN